MATVKAAIHNGHVTIMQRSIKRNAKSPTTGHNPQYQLENCLLSSKCKLAWHTPRPCHHLIGLVHLTEGLFPFLTVRFFRRLENVLTFFLTHACARASTYR